MNDYILTILADHMATFAQFLNLGCAYGQVTYFDFTGTGYRVALLTMCEAES